MKKSLQSLALGGLGLGMTEFVMMGILPDIANDLEITIPKASHFISAYAIGVSIGVLLFILFSRTKMPKHILLAFMALFTIFNSLSSLSGDYWTMLIMRFLSGLPHGAYLGAGAVVAARIAGKEKTSQSVFIIFAGLTVANLIGVPFGTYIGNAFSWRYTFIIVGLWGVLTLYFLYRWIPDLESVPDGGFKQQFAFFKSFSTWLLISVVFLENGGFFAWYSYISPLMTNISGIGKEYISWIMVVAGSGMVAGNLVSGKLSDRYAPQRMSVIFLIMLTMLLLCIFFFSTYTYISILLTFLAMALAIALSVSIQILLIRNAHGREILSTTLSQVSFNIGNAMGAYCGGLPIVAGFSYTYPSLIGAGFTFIAFGVMLFFNFCQRRRHVSLS